MPDEPETPLLTDIADGVATFTLNRPEALNALNAQLRRELLAAFKAIARDAGRSLRRDHRRGPRVLRRRRLARRVRLSATSGRVLGAEYNPLIAAIRNLPKPVVAAVNGVAAGAGVSLAFAADVVVASEEARFVPAFNRIGLVPDSGLARTLVRGVGRHRAFEILMGERQLGAARRARPRARRGGRPRRSPARMPPMSSRSGSPRVRRCRSG